MIARGGERRVMCCCATTFQGAAERLGKPYCHFWTNAGFAVADIGLRERLRQSMA